MIDKAIPATEAKVWDGMKFEVRSKESSFKNSAGEMVSYGTLVPVAYLGVGNVTAEAGTPAAPAAAPNATPTQLTAADLGTLNSGRSSLVTYNKKRESKNGIRYPLP